MFSIVSFKKLSQKNIISRLFSPAKAVLEQFEDSFGIINVYTIFFYRNKEKALSKLMELSNEKIYTEKSEIPEKYFKRLCCEQLIDQVKQQDSATLTLYFLPEKSTLINLIRNFKTVYMMGASLPDFADEIWEECGTLPITCNFPPKTDYKITGNEKPILKELPMPYADICPKDFPKTLFAALLYKENGIFIK